MWIIYGSWEQNLSTGNSLRFEMYNVHARSQVLQKIQANRLTLLQKSHLKSHWIVLWLADRPTDFLGNSTFEVYNFYHSEEEKHCISQVQSKSNLRTIVQNLRAEWLRRLTGDISPFPGRTSHCQQIPWGDGAAKDHGKKEFGVERQ